jgi:hypothetical protein
MHTNGKTHSAEPLHIRVACLYSNMLVLEQRIPKCLLSGRLESSHPKVPGWNARYIMTQNVGHSFSERTLNT